MGTMTRRLAVALAAAGLLVSVGCAKDETVTSTSTSTPVTASSGGGSGTTEPEQGTDEDEDKDKGSGEYDETCATLEELDALESDTPDDDAFALMEEARDSGPEELADHWDTLIAVFEDLMAVDENDDEAIAKVFELMDDPEFLEAAAAIDDFAEEECGLDIDLDPSEESVGGLEPDGPGSEDTIPGGDPTSIDALQAYLEAEHGTEDWWPVFDDASSWGSTGSGDSVEWSVTFSSSSDWESLSASDIENGCDAMAEYLDIYEAADVSIEISDPDENVIVSRDPGELCQTV